MNLSVTLAALVAIALTISASAQDVRPRLDLTHPQPYKVHRSSSTDPLGGNADRKLLAPSATMTLLDVDGPGLVPHIWMTTSDTEKFHLKRLVLRMYWDNETNPSVESPVGDFFGLNVGDYFAYESAVLSIGNSKGLNSFFPMPFRKHARITLTNEGKVQAGVYYNIEYLTGAKEADSQSLYFHAQYRQATPNHGWTNDFYSNSDARITRQPNKDGKDNYVFMEATGKGHYVGVTLGVLQNQDGWWGEGDEMLFVDDPYMPAIVGTGSEDYILGGWNFKLPFSYQTYGAPLVGAEYAGGRSDVYRFHLDSPIPFDRYFRGTIESGTANHRSDNYYSVAYWYQTEPHAPFPALPPVEERLPAVMSVGGPGNGPQKNEAPPLPPPATPTLPAPGMPQPTAPTVPDSAKEQPK